MTSVQLSGASKVLETFATKTLPAVGVEAQRRATAWVAWQEVFHAPVGSATPGWLGIRRLHADPHPGLFRASFLTSAGEPQVAALPRASGGYAIPGLDDMVAPLAGLQFGEPSFVTNDAQSEKGFIYAWPVGVVGRSTDSLGRPSGSLQAPEGTARLAVVYVAEEWPRIVAQAILARGVR